MTLGFLLIPLHADWPSSGADGLAGANFGNFADAAERGSGLVCGGCPLNRIFIRKNLASKPIINYVERSLVKMGP